MKRFLNIQNLAIYICNIDNTPEKGDELNIVEAQKMGKALCIAASIYGKDMDSDNLYKIVTTVLPFPKDKYRRVCDQLVIEFKWRAFTFNQWRLSKIKIR